MAPKTVWVLGAGFSRSLGGPMLVDLLSKGTRGYTNELYRAYPNVRCTAADAVYALFDRGHSEKGGMWPHAEVFLDMLDAAGMNPDGARAVHLVNTCKAASRIEQPIAELRAAARRLVAAECCAFLRDADREEERWEPYMQWSTSLGPSDTIVTFNYDLVLERTKRVRVIEARDPLSLSAEHASVLKLHGSVNWRRTEFSGNVVYIPSDDDEFALTCPLEEIGIATPGPSKKSAANELRTLWFAAEERLKEAEVVVFVGYRFPPTDAQARRRLLSALRANMQPHIDVHIVLGANVGSDDVLRLQQLLRAAMSGGPGRGDWETSRLMPTRQRPNRTFQLTTHALFAEDFFMILTPEMLAPVRVSAE